MTLASVIALARGGVAAHSSTRQRLHSLKRNPLHRLLHQILGHSLDTTGLLVQRNLAISTSATWIIEQSTNIIEIRTGTQIIGHIIDQVEQFMDRVAHAEMSS